MFEIIVTNNLNALIRDTKRRGIFVLLKGYYKPIPRKEITNHRQAYKMFFEFEKHTVRGDWKRAVAKAKQLIEEERICRRLTYSDGSPYEGRSTPSQEVRDKC